MLGADGGTRTRTTLSDQRILSPLRLPFRHIGMDSQATNQAVPEGCARTKFAEWGRLLNEGEFFGDRVLSCLERELRADPFGGSRL